MDIKIPSLGDGVDSADVVSILVAVGDVVEKEQTLLELETEKATAPVPSSAAGKVEAILVKEGDTVRPGSVVVKLEGSSSSAPVEKSAPSAATPSTATAPTSANAVAAIAPPVSMPNNGEEPPAPPALRKMAGILGLNLSLIGASGRGGRITYDDVRGYLHALQSGSLAAPAVAASTTPTVAAEAPAKSLPDFSKFGEITKKPLSKIRKTISKNLSYCWNTIPHVTQFDEANITELMALRKKHNTAFKKLGGNLTPTLFAIKAAVEALKEFPQFNASLDLENNEIILKNYINIGVAVDTENGLLVPVIKNADKKSLLELALEMNELAEKARDKKLTMDEMSGACFTITNLGSLGVSSFTPIVNWPEVAILGLGRGAQKPVVSEKGIIEAGTLLPMGLSYDHRAIDGADGARFIRNIIETLHDFDTKWIKEENGK